MLLAFCAALAFQQPADRTNSLIDAIVAIVGVSSAEELTESEIERFMSFASSPLRINTASRSRIASSGLLSAYQAASLYDYRSRHGDVLSPAELSLVDGFGSGAAEALAPFLSFESASLPGERLSDKTVKSRSLILKTSFASRDDGRKNGRGWSAGVKYRHSADDVFEMALTARKSYDAERFFPPPEYTFHAVKYGRRGRGKMIIGDYNARFGQGLALWSGFEMTSVPAVSAFSKRSSGISPSWSYSSENTHRGAAVEQYLGNFRLSCLMSFPGLDRVMQGNKSARTSFFCGANVTWFTADGQVGVTASSESLLSADADWNIRGVRLFSELAAALKGGGAFAGTAGASVGLFDGGWGAVRLRMVPAAFSGKKNGEYGMALGFEFSAGPYVQMAGRQGFGSSKIRHQFSLTAEASALPVPVRDPDRRQLRLVSRYDSMLSPSMSLSVRFSGRWRNYGALHREDLRADLGWSDGRWSCRSRLNAVTSESFGWLCYLDGGYEAGRMSLFLRGTYYDADKWNDRVYCYERDAPGNFNVTAYHGRGFAVSLVGSCRLGKGRRRSRLYLRASRKKPGKAELKFQYMLDF